MSGKVYFVFIISVLFTANALLGQFGKIRKRKNFRNVQNNTVEVDDLAMYYTRRTTPFPRLRVTVDPSIEAYYQRKHRKEELIKRAYFEKAKKQKRNKQNPIEKNKDPSLQTAPALD
ncbi:uncharacterized protein LOC128989844 [Macrosteles quadrilineatus]|uniref:uncharacterized protein LOC128989844 n=1 Tax=Macrosteles quadrilineatus TaxID=74068 RepID=UPI0023E094FA|nr:uncharacterized protein LOC128989844 [Macrosteles quadrilineatus]